MQDTSHLLLLKNFLKMLLFKLHLEVATLQNYMYVVLSTHVGFVVVTFLLFN